MSETIKKELETKIELQHLIKIYGNQPHVALKLFREGKTRDDICDYGVIRFGKIHLSALY